MQSKSKIQWIRFAQERRRPYQSGLNGHHQLYSGVGADIVMESITLIDPDRAQRELRLISSTIIPRDDLRSLSMRPGRSDALHWGQTLWPIARFSESPPRWLWPSLPWHFARSLPRSQLRIPSRFNTRSPARHSEPPTALGRKFSSTRPRPPESLPTSPQPRPLVLSTSSIPARVSHGSPPIPQPPARAAAFRATHGSIPSQERLTSRCPT